MKKICFILLTMLFWAAVVCSAQTIELRSDRSARAEVKEDKTKQNYTVQICFAPVTTLDSVTNDEMTVMLAQFFTEEALSIFFNKTKSVIFSGIPPQVLKRDKKMISMQYVIPLKNICKPEKKQDASTAEAMLKKFYSSSKHTSESLLSDFRSTCFRDLRSAELFFVSKIAETKDKTRLEKKIRQAFAALLERINNDDALFMSEKDELSEKAKKVEAFLLKRLHTADGPRSGDAAAAATPDNISKATFLPQFKEFLLYDKILLEVGGCRAFEDKSGKRALIAVGVASVADNSPGDIFMIAEQKAFGELAKYNNMEITFFTERSKTTEIKTQNGTESGKSHRTSSSRITGWAAAHIDRMITVGHWFSKDGKLFFLAKGCFIK